jgi:hypothetical protein
LLFFFHDVSVRTAESRGGTLFDPIDQLRLSKLGSPHRPSFVKREESQAPLHWNLPVKLGRKQEADHAHWEAGRRKPPTEDAAVHQICAVLFLL